ncbi:MAG: YggS family pyridoxal phosphate-dependent enzyme [Planctomycetota bacterium]|nr:MAG: YggS family pyridoxal phosphate-dependent enzyme [Planctomycetota bacterium]REK21783.1 MAG: YggS family pyridoxal phosphate-dependent enzyme [Planctomycetota bacterium]REK43188.1 MAG: YggS family pyridoxal phosphate-dependent enzyme [Planctomycetota bacterium]
MSDRLRTVERNLAAVHDAMATAAAQAGRSPDDVRLVAVTKYVDTDVVRDLVAAGCRSLGESRPQALWEKADALADLDVEWHLVGHLQRNKVRRTLPAVQLTHSVDSTRLLQEMDREAVNLPRPANVLLEVNISGDAEKHGFAPANVREVVERAGKYPHVQVCGLMTMAHREGGAEVARRDFAALRRLRDELVDRAPPNVRLDELSMGMSNDYPQAILEGATLIRVGRALYEGVPD